MVAVLNYFGYFSVRTAAVLPHILPKLVHLPLSYVQKFLSALNFQREIHLVYQYIFVYSAFNAHALGALAEVAGPGLNFHLGTVLPALLSAMGDGDEV